MNLLKNFETDAIIFDKDGTLIDFDAMWGGWTLQLADRFHEITGLNVRETLCAAYGYDIGRNKIIRDGLITYTPMWKLREIMVEAIASLGFSNLEAESMALQVWLVPDPIVLAKPFTNLQQLFKNIQAMNIKIAIATTDDRAPTQAMLEAFDLSQYISTMICADDGIPTKPAPDTVNIICSRISVDPSKTIVIGDTVADMRMGRSAGAGLVIGVLSGVGSLDNLTPLADILVDSIDTLHASFAPHEISAKLDVNDGISDLNPDLALG